MNKKLLVALSLITGQVMAMEPMELTKDDQPVIPSDTPEEKVVITIQDQEREIPKRYIPLIGTLATLYKEGTPLQMSPITLVSLETWKIIEDQLERVYEFSQGNEQVRYEIIRELELIAFKKKEEDGMTIISDDYTRLLDLIRVVDYLGIYILRDIALDVAASDYLGAPIDEVLELPEVLRNEVIKRRVFRICGLEVLHFFKGVFNPCASVCVPDPGHDQFIILGSADGTVRFWNSYFQESVDWTAHKGEVSSVCATTDGKIVSCSKDETTVCVWGIDGEELAVCRGHEKGVTSVCVTLDSSKIVSGSEDGTIRIWDMNGQKLAVCNGHEAPVRSVHVTKDNKIVSGSDDRTVRIWDMNGKEQAVFKGHEAPVRSVYVTKDNMIVSGSDDKTVRIWDTDGKEHAVCKDYESGGVSSVCVTNDNRIVSVYGNGRVGIWDMNGTKLFFYRGDVVKSVCVRLDNFIPCGCLGGTVREINIRLLDRLSVMSEEQAKLIDMILLYTREILRDFGEDDDDREIVYRISTHCLYKIDDILSERRFVVETKKRKELKDSDNNAAKKVRFEEELDNENM